MGPWGSLCGLRPQLHPCGGQWVPGGGAMGPRRTRAAETWLGLQGSTPGVPTGLGWVSTSPNTRPCLPGPEPGLWSGWHRRPGWREAGGRSWLLACPSRRKGRPPSTWPSPYHVRVEGVGCPAWGNQGTVCTVLPCACPALPQPWWLWPTGRGRGWRGAVVGRRALSYPGSRGVR